VKELAVETVGHEAATAEDIAQYTAIGAASLHHALGAISERRPVGWGELLLVCLSA
jgi:hypothetical protein